MLLSQVSIHRPVFATMLNGALLVFGLLAFQRLGVDQYPIIDYPVVGVEVAYPGADPLTVEQKVIEPLEKVMGGLEGLVSLNATATPGLARLQARFRLERPSDRAAQDVRDKLGTVLGALPRETTPPLVSKFDMAGSPVVLLSLRGGELPLGELSRLAQDRVRPALEQVIGVGQVDLVGNRNRQIHVLLNRQRLGSFNVSPQEVVTALQGQGVDLPSGRIQNDTQLIRIRTEATLRSHREVGQIPLVLKDRTVVRLQNLGSTQDTLEDEKTFATHNGQPAIIFQVYKQPGGNIVAIAQGVEQAAQRLKNLLPPGAQLEVVQDNSQYTKGVMEGVLFDLILGAFLAVVLVFVFLGDWKSTLISACAIPTSVVGTLAFIYFMGFTLNTMTALALTLSIGILVDDAIVVIENIHRRLPIDGNAREAAQRGAGEIGLAALAITLSIVAVFIPVAFMDGIMGRFFYEFGITVSIAVLLSLFVAFTVTPMLSSRYLKAQAAPHHSFTLFEKTLAHTTAFYRKVLEWCLKRPRAVIGFAGAVLVFSVGLLAYVPILFFPTEDTGFITVDYAMNDTAPLSHTKERASQMAAKIQENPAVKSVVTTVGSSSGDTTNQARFHIVLQNKTQRHVGQMALMEALRRDLAPWAQGDSGESLVVSAPRNALAVAVAPIQLILQSHNSQALQETAQQLLSFMKTQVPGVVDATLSTGQFHQEVRIVPDVARAADLGFNAASLGQNLNILFEGETVGAIEDKGVLYDIVVKMEGLERSDLQTLQGISLPNLKGVAVNLASVARVETGLAPGSLEKRGGQRQVTVQANDTGENLRATLKRVDTYLKNHLPPDVTAQWDGEAQLMAQSLGSFQGALVFASVLVFMVLCAQFESYTTPFVIMVSVPMAFSGAFLALLLTGKPLSIYAMIGLIMLVGLVTKNAILLVDFARNRVAQGWAADQALLEAGVVRLRPILMTTLAMMGGMLPMALGHGEGGEARSPMAVCVMGGLLSSMALTLVVVPCVYQVLHRWQTQSPSPLS